MNDDSRLEELLTEWELARLEGYAVSAVDLTRKCPELTEQLRNEIAVLEATSWVVDGPPKPNNDNGAQRAVGDASLPITELSAAEFIQSLSDTALLADDQLETIRSESHAEQSARPLAERLVNEGLLTSYQAETLLTRGDSPLLLDRYIILDVLGSGGMGLVFKALHRSMERVVALKVLPKDAVDTPAKVARFQQEIKAAAKLTHPNIVAAYDAHEAEGTHFLVMEFVSGSNLEECIERQGPLSPSEVATVVALIAGALQSAHEQGIVHRDVKPSNILLSDDGVPKLLDLGLARIKKEVEGEVSSINLTREGVPMGTAAYIAPEQAMDSKHADARSDIYSLGCTLHFLLTGNAVFEKETGVQMIAAHLKEEPPSLSTACPDVPESLAQVFSKMVDKTPANRFASMAEVVEALEATGLVDADRVPPPVVPRKRSTLTKTSANRRRSVVMAAGAAALLASVLILFLWAPWRGKQPTTTAQPTISERDLAKWVFNSGGAITAETPFGKQYFTDASELPDGDFEITAIDLYEPQTSINFGVLGQLPKLNRLSLVGFSRDMLFLDKIVTLNRVTYLDLNECSLVDDDLRVISKMSQLEQLDLSDNDLSGNAIKHLASLKRLELLYLTNTNVSDAGIQHLEHLPQLQLLDLDGTQITDGGMEVLVKLPNLLHLDLSNTTITDGGIEEIAKVKNLEHLWLDYCEVTDDGVSHFLALEKLIHLSLAGTQVADKGVAEVAKLQQLEVLDLSTTKITSKAIDQLRDMPRLIELRLEEMSLTDEVLTSIVSLDGLQILDLSGTDLDDARLQQLTALRQLDSLFVDNTDVTEAGLDRFQAARPQVTVFTFDGFVEPAELIEE